MPNTWKKCALTLLMIIPLSACQQFLPKAQGLATTQWTAQHYQRQDQVEVQWKEHSFSFLLYQQQTGQDLDFLALSLTGQQLFKLHFDGQKVTVEQRIDAMRLLPFEFVVRDVLFATYPRFIEHPPKNVQVNKLDTNNGLVQEIEINQQKVLNIRHTTAQIELENVQVPYQMVFSEVANTLENNE
ncbi:DUF3261 domain-containing protein [Acinetobacter defluvii]|uniref:DUF3261 domain-containing protein n=1 Tax=Acinetobacter defluvii TaxID=1871111 RepID=UPI0014903A26|nr:DUF3261 domain-containing protein [Acinetobacter defluvii]NNP72843.1 DUF3261 domain-containing protein [Acinetobacter defluvii]